MASQDAPAPLLTAETLRKLEAMRIENHEQYVLQQTVLDQLKEVQEGVGA